ncbi:hypothetical protein ILYODFUR_013892, partial [Ilyodon furcidens]
MYSYHGPVWVLLCLVVTLCPGLVLTYSWFLAWSFILEKPIRIPRSLSVKAASVLKGFLNKDPKERLGCQVQTGFTDIKSHTFFRSIDWDQ